MTNQLIVHDNVLIKKNDMIEYHNDKKLLLNTEKKIKEMTIKAEEYSDYIYASSYINGYSDGVIMSIRSVIDLINNRIELSENIYFESLKKIELKLSEILNCNKLALCLIFDKIQTMSSFENENEFLFIVLPFSFMDNANAIEDEIKKCWPGKYKVDYHEQQRFIVKYKDQIIEFSPDEFIRDKKKEFISIEDVNGGEVKITLEYLYSIQNMINDKIVDITTGVSHDK